MKTKLPRMTLYKSNSKGTGGVISFEVQPAYEDQKGFLKMIMADQSGDGFDWKGRIELNLSLLNVFALLPALNGRVSSARAVSRSEDGDVYTTEVVREKGGGVTVRVLFRSQDGCFDERYSVVLANHEAEGIASTVESVLGRIAFGV